MKKIMGNVLMGLGIISGLALAFLAVDMTWNEVAFAGFSKADSIVWFYVVVLVLAGAELFFAIRWGLTHEKRGLAGLLLGSAVVFLAIGVNFVIGYTNSLPTPTDAWLANMATSRSHILGEAAVVDASLVQQGRTLLLVSAGIGILFGLIPGWFGITWLLKKPSQA